MLLRCYGCGQAQRNFKDLATANFLTCFTSVTLTSGFFSMGVPGVPQKSCLGTNELMTSSEVRVVHSSLATGCWLFSVSPVVSFLDLTLGSSTCDNRVEGRKKGFWNMKRPFQWRPWIWEFGIQKVVLFFPYPELWIKLLHANSRFKVSTITATSSQPSSSSTSPLPKHPHLIVALLSVWAGTPSWVKSSCF